MAKTVIETFYSSYSKYEVVRSSTWLSTSFHIYKDGKYDSTYASLREAVQAARRRVER